MTTVRIYYHPADPGSVSAVTNLRLNGVDYPNGTRVGNRWVFEVPTLSAGSYPLDFSVLYVDSTTSHDTNDTMVFPIPEPAQDGEPLLPWCTLADLPAGTDATLGALACQVATDVLYELSGQRYDGLRVSAIQAPALPAIKPTLTPLAHIPDGMWNGYADFQGGISLCRWATHLPGVRDVMSFTIGTTVVDIDTVEIESSSILHVLPDPAADPGALGVNRCPCGCGLSLFPGGGAYEIPRADVTVTWGIDPPAGGVLAARLFAAEIVKGAVGLPCAISGQATQIAQEGVTILLDPQTYLKERRTGLAFADVWLTSLPGSRAPEATVWSPDLPYANRVR